MHPEGMAGAIAIRRGDATDAPFLQAMLLEAANWHPERRPVTLEQALADSQLARYARDWGRPGDTAVIAEWDGVPVGAAWYRLFDAAEPGYGFVDADTPELSIGVVAEWRGRGIGRRLLEALLGEARRAGIRALSLSVEPDNARAVALYERLGFARLGDRGGAWMMRWTASGSAPPARSG